VQRILVRLGVSREMEPDGRGRGLVNFMAGSLAFAACFNFWAAIYAIARAASFAAAPRYVFGDLRTWGFLTLAISISQFGAAAGLLTGSLRARWLGAGLAFLNGIGQISGLPGYPLWFLVVTAVDMVVLSGMAIYGMQLSREAARRSASARPGAGIPPAGG